MNAELHGSNGTLLGTLGLKHGLLGNISQTEEPNQSSILTTQHVQPTMQGPLVHGRAGVPVVVKNIELEPDGRRN